jgi:ketosteroid isomerase-like protein
MSRENVEVVKQVFDAAGRRDGASVLALYDTEVEWDASRIPLGGLMGRVVYGHDDLRNWFREWFGASEGLEDLYDELIDAGEQVISVARIRAQGRSSGVQVEMRGAAAWTIREGKIVRVVWFPTREEALEAVGLRE